MRYPTEAIRQSLDEEGVVLLQEFITLSKDTLQDIPLEESYNPLTHKWLSYKGKLLEKKLGVLLARLEVFGSFTPELLVLRPGDYSLVHDNNQEEGIVGFLSLDDWDYEQGGYLAVDQEPIYLPQNALLLVQGRFVWFIKKISNQTNKNKTIIVLRNEQ